jgi:heme/copper-type cytochrome/quinol oxidase subunit 1
VYLQHKRQGMLLLLLLLRSLVAGGVDDAVFRFERSISSRAKLISAKQYYNIGVESVLRAYSEWKFRSPTPF